MTANTPVMVSLSNHDAKNYRPQPLPRQDQGEGNFGNFGEAMINARAAATTSLKGRLASK